MKSISKGYKRTCSYCDRKRYFLNSDNMCQSCEKDREEKEEKINVYNIGNASVEEIGSLLVDLADRCGFKIVKKTVGENCSYELIERKA